ncbi:MAG: hypothetical protein IJN66_00905 [Muribaculaceae bacterium]|nr:hypothetical protein [Muribaculaceae bacterium]
MDICDRINLIIEKEGLTVASFARKIGTGDQTVRGCVIQRRNKPSYEFIAKIIQTFDWLNPRWFITGEGEMIMPKNEPQPSLDSLIKYLREKDDKIEKLIEEKTLLRAKCEIYRSDSTNRHTTLDSLSLQMK